MATPREWLAPGCVGDARARVARAPWGVRSGGRSLFAMVVTAAVFQLMMSWLNCVAPSNTARGPKMHAGRQHMHA